MKIKYDYLLQSFFIFVLIQPITYCERKENGSSCSSNSECHSGCCIFDTNTCQSADHCRHPFFYIGLPIICVCLGIGIFLGIYFIVKCRRRASQSSSIPLITEKEISTVEMEESENQMDINSSMVS